MATNGGIMELANTISSKVAELNDYLKAMNLPEPSLGIDAPAALPLPSHLTQARLNILVALDELKARIEGPVEILAQLSSPACFKVGEEVAYPDLAKKCGVAEPDLRRIMRMLIAARIFDEPRKGVVAHNGVSKLLNENQIISEFMGYATQTIWSSGFCFAEAVSEYPDAQELDETAFHILRGSTFWDRLKQDEPDRRRFTAAMAFLQSNSSFGSHHLLKDLEWDQANCPQSMVDVGGHHGRVDMEILRKYPTINCIVQDLSEAIANATVPEDLQGRLQFQVHDFFTPQPVQADVYLLRLILHDWPDKYARKIISNLIPALKHGAKVVVNECCMPDPGQIPKYHEARLRGFDLCMKQFFNSKERDIEEWIELFQGCDTRFHFSRIHVSPGSVLAMIEFVWMEAGTS